jgi:cysteine-rich repeat protein
MVYDPVCGVDGNTYGNGCEAGIAGVDVDYPGECQVCGNGTLEGPEECDDSNLVDGDGCSSTCQSECIEGVTTITRNAGTLETFSTVQAAIDDPNAVDSDTIQITAAHFDEAVFFDRGIILTLSGGYTCDFLDNLETSSINSLTVSNGTAVVDNLIIKPNL